MNTKPLNLDGYETLYTINENGWIFSLGRDKYLTNSIGVIRNKSTDGYVITTLAKDGGKTQQFIHRLLALTFIPNSDSSKIQVNHKDGNKFNNALSNLEWCTASENTQHAVDTGLLVPVTGLGHGLSRQVLLHKIGGEVIEMFDSITIAAEQLDINKQTLRRRITDQKPLFANGNYVSILTKSIHQTTLDGIFVKEHASIKDAADAVTLSVASISMCLNKHRPQTGGYKWNWV